MCYIVIVCYCDVVVVDLTPRFIEIPSPAALFVMLRISSCSHYRRHHRHHHHHHHHRCYRRRYVIIAIVVNITISPPCDDRDAVSTVFPASPSPTLGQLASVALEISWSSKSPF